MDRLDLENASAVPAGTSAYLPGLVWTIIRTDFKSRYHGTIGGFFWAMLRPAAIFIVLLSVFSLIFRDDPHYRLNLIIGLFLWDFFSESTRSGLGALQAKGYLLTKARFPSWIVVVTSASNAIIAISVFSVVLCAFIAIFERTLGPVELIAYFSYLVAFLIQVTGLSLATSVLFLRYRDLNQIWDLVIQAGFFVAPVIYPLSIIPEWAHFYLYAWLPTPIIQFSRMVLIHNELPTATGHLYLAGVTALVFVAGVLIFRQMAPRAIEEL